MGLKVKTQVKFLEPDTDSSDGDDNAGPSPESQDDHGKSERLLGQRQKVLGSQRGSISFGLRKLRAVQFFDGGDDGKGSINGDEEEISEHRTKVLGSKRGSVSFGLKKFALISFADDCKADKKDDSITEQRSQVLGSRKGTVFLGNTKFKAVHFDEATRQEDEVVDEAAKASGQEETTTKESFLEQRVKFLGSRRGSISLGKKKVKMVSFDAPADALAREDTASTEETKENLHRKSISGLRSTILGSRRGSITLGRKKERAVQFAGAPANSSIINDDTTQDAGHRMSLSGLRSVVLGSRRGSISAKPKEVDSIPEGLIAVNPEDLVEHVDDGTRESRQSHGHGSRRGRLSTSFLRSERPLEKEAGGLGIGEGKVKRRSSLTMPGGFLFGYGKDKGSLDVPRPQVFPDIAV